MNPVADTARSGEPRRAPARRNRSPLRFAYLSFDFGVPIGGRVGNSVHVQQTVVALRGLGHTVEVFSPSAPSDGGAQAGVDCVSLTGFAREAVDQVTLELTRPSHLGKELRSLIYAEYAQRILLPRLAKFEPHLIYERYSLFSYAGVELAASLGVPLVLEVNAPLSLEQAVYRELVLRQTASALERSILGSADAVIVVSAELAEHARCVGVPPGKVTLLPNAVDARRFHPSVAGSAVRSEYGLSGTRVIGFVGSLKLWHDLDTLLGAVGQIARDDESVRLLVVGDGPRLLELRRSAAPWLICTGAVSHKRVPEFLAAMDVVAIPYPAGGHTYFSPLKLYEAMAMARPIVGARSGQVAEVLGDEKAGLLYEPGDVDGLVARIVELLESRERAEALGRTARERVVASHTWDDNARRIVALARQLVRASWAR